MSRPQVLLIGAGGVGAIVAYGVYYADKADISIVVRRDYEKASKDGYHIKSFDYGDVPSFKPQVYPNIEAASAGGPYDYVLVCTKCLPDVEELTNQKMEDLIEPVISPSTTIVRIQNGLIGSYPKYPDNVCLSGVIHIGSHNHDCYIEQVTTEKMLISAFFEGNVPDKVQIQKAKDFVDIYSHEKHQVIYFEDAKWYRYRKLLFNASFSPACALSQCDVGRITLSGALPPLVIPAMKEVIAVAKADGKIMPKDAINSVCHVDDGAWFEPSMLVDLRRNQPTEYIILLGNVTDRARELGVSTPILDVFFQLMKSIQFRLLAARKLITLPDEWKGTNEYYQ